MKVIELLNRIANGEEVPNKIKYRNKIFIYDKDNLCYVVGNYNEYGDLLVWLSNHKGTDLNYEVEIIEEEQEDNFTGWKMYKNGKQVCSIEDEILETQTTRIKLDKDRKIEKLDQRIDTGLFGSQIKDEIEVANTINKQANYISDIVNKINEIIDKINKENI